jgi:hypothetical protein
MTVAVVITIYDGVILASDSASTMSRWDPAGGAQFVNIYNNAEKVFRLSSTVPVGAVTYGLGNIGGISIGTLLKEVRKRIDGRSRDHQHWQVDGHEDAVRRIAERVIDLIYDEHYLPILSQGQPAFSLGCKIAGYAADSLQPEVWGIDFSGPTRPQPELVRAGDHCGISCDGEPEAISRLMFGYSPHTLVVLRQIGVSDPVLDRSRLWSSGLHVQVPENAPFLFHMGKIGLGEVIDLGMLGGAPIPAFDSDEAAIGEQPGQGRLVIGRAFVDEGAVFHRNLAVKRAQEPVEPETGPIEPGQHLEVDDRQPQDAPRHQHPAPFGQHRRDFLPVEIVDYLAGIDQPGRGVGEKVEPANVLDMIDMGERHPVDMDEARDMALATAEMELDRVGHGYGSQDLGPSGGKPPDNGIAL